MLRFVRDPAASEDKYYDVIGFDSRGVNNTTPRHQCITEPYSRQRWTLDNRFLDLLGSSDVATEKAWARAMALADTCTGEGGPEIGEFMNTTPTVADVIEIIERHGEWREKEANALLESEQYKSNLPDSERQAIRDATRWRREEEPLQYWGFSYGAVLGATFVAMQPHRAKRMVLDGICDARAMYSGFWNTSILDTDKVMERFFESCQQAGPEQCSFSTGGTLFDLQMDLEDTLQSLKQTPLAVPGTETRGLDVITYSDVMRLIKDALYDPLRLFPVLADMLTDVSRGNGSAFADMKMAAKTSICRPPSSSDGGDNDSGSLPAIYRHHPRNPGVNRLHRRLRSHRADKTRFL